MMEKDEESDISWIASIEAFIAMASAIAYATYIDSFAVIAISACMAPALLFRSSESQALGIAWFSIVHDWIARRSYVIRLLLTPLVLMSAVLIRVVSTVAHLRSGLRCFTRNWKKQVWATHIFSEPELIPGGKSYEKLIDTFEPTPTFVLIWLVFFFLFFVSIVLLPDETYCFPGDCATQVGSFISLLIHFVGGVSALMFFSLIVSYVIIWLSYFISIVYRFSLKSTALLWLPLIFTVRSAYETNVPIAVTVREMRASNLWELLRLVALATLGVFLFKIAVLPSIEGWDEFRWARTINVYLTPGEIYPWQIASVVNSIATLLGFYLFIDRAPLKLETLQWSAASVNRGLKFFRIFRSTISTYTIPALLLITLNAAKYVEWKLVFVTQPLPQFN